MDEPSHKAFLKKEEKKDQWAKYWVVLRNCALYFYNEQTDPRDEYCEKIELTANARCSVVQRRMYSYRFLLVTEKGSWLLKCQTILQRDGWMQAIDLAAQEMSSEATELALVAVTEQDLSVKSMRREIQQLEPLPEDNNNTPEELSLKIHSQEKDKRERQNFKKSLKLKKSDQKDKDSKDQDLSNLVENLAFHDCEVGEQTRRKYKLGESGSARKKSIRSAAGAAKLIRVESVDV